jgi:uncharacterized damage-inducible protein DinB
MDTVEFLSYFDKVRERTLRVARVIPPERLEWSWSEGRFTFGDILRHLGAIERWMFAENARLLPSLYPGHGRELADGWDQTFAYLARMHAEALAIFRALSPEDWQRRCTTPGGTQLAVWKWLRSMVEHEIHHRGQLYVYLAMLGVPTPPLYGLTSEQVQARSVRD